MNAKDIVDNLVSLARDAIERGGSLDEVIDSYIDTSTDDHQLAILNELGDVPLDAPLPDLSQGWSRVRGQLAYNALYHHVSRAIGGKS
jgi:hypothetical protein